MDWTIIKLRIMAAVAIIAIHAAAPAAFQYDTLPHSEWWIANLWASATHWAVPVFIMISGQLMIGKKFDQKKRFQRLAIPLLFWVVAYALFHHWWRGDTLNPVFILQRFLFDQPYEHLFFLVILMMLSAITPALTSLISKMSQKNIHSLLLFSLGLTWWWKPWRFILPIAIPYVSYYLLGWYLSKKQKNTKNLTSKIFWFGLLGFVLTIAIGTWLLVSHTIPNSNGLYFYTFSNPLSMGLSVLIFIGSKKWLATKPSEKIQKILLSLSKVTLGVYLLHPMVLAVLTYLFHSKIGSFSQLYEIPILIVGTALISWGLCFGVHKTKFLSSVVS